MGGDGQRRDEQDQGSFSRSSRGLVASRRVGGALQLPPSSAPRERRREEGSALRRCTPRMTVPLSEHRVGLFERIAGMTWSVYI